MDDADDGWDQDGWFGEDDQASFEINPHGKSFKASKPIPL
jgi:hypothetical protein